MISDNKLKLGVAIILVIFIFATILIFSNDEFEGLSSIIVPRKTLLAQVGNPPDLKDGLISHWPMDNTTADTVGGRHGSVCQGTDRGDNCVGFIGAYVPGVISEAISLNSTKYVALGYNNGDGDDDDPTDDDPFLSHLRTFSLSMWFKMDIVGDTTYRKFYTERDTSDSTNPAFDLGINDPNAGYGWIKFFYRTVASGRSVSLQYLAPSSNRPNNGAWHHLVAVRSGAAWRLYYDGSRVSAVLGNLENFYANSACIGAQCNNSSVERHFVGSIDDVRMYNRALSDLDVSALFSGSPPDPPRPTGSTGSACGGRITVSWNDVSGANSYKLYRDGSPINLLGSNYTWLSYEDTVDSNTSHSYRLRATNDLGDSRLSSPSTPPTTSSAECVTLTVAKSGLGTISAPGLVCGAVNCQGSYKAGENVTLTAYPDSTQGYFFAGWAGACSGGGNCFLTVGADLIAEAIFATRPLLSNIEPTGNLPAGTTFVDMRVTTDRIARCKYDEADVSYKAMANTFTATNSVNHSERISGLANGTTKKYFITCKDLTEPARIVTAKLFDASLRAQLLGSMKGEWTLNEGTGNTATDASNNNNNGTLFGPTWVGGILGEALYFDGNDDYVDVPDSPTLNFDSDSFSLGLWYKLRPDGTGGGNGYETLLTKGGTASDVAGYAVEYDIPDDGIGNKGIEMHVSDGTNKMSWGNNPEQPDYRDNRWHHFFSVIDKPRNQLRTFIDAVEQTPLDVVGLSSVSNNSRNLNFSRSSGGKVMDGALDEIRLFAAAPSTIPDLEELFTNDPSAQVEFNVEMPSFDLDLNVSGNGIIEDNTGGISCRPACTARFEENREITLTASADAGYEFLGWSGDCAGTGSCKLNMTRDLVVGAVFDRIPKYLFEINITGSGKVTGLGIDCGTDCSESYDKGTTVTFQALPVSSGYTFIGWTGDCAGITCALTVSNDALINANFTPTATISSGQPINCKVGNRVRAVTEAFVYMSPNNSSIDPGKPNPQPSIILGKVVAAPGGYSNPTENKAESVWYCYIDYDTGPDGWIMQNIIYLRPTKYYQEL